MDGGLTFPARWVSKRDSKRFGRIVTPRIILVFQVFSLKTKFFLIAGVDEMGEIVTAVRALVKFPHY